MSFFGFVGQNFKPLLSFNPSLEWYLMMSESEAKFVKVRKVITGRRR